MADGDTSKPGIVYFLDAGRFIKIGFTSGDISKRMSGVQVGCPFELHLMGVIPGDEGMEAQMHERFKEHHVRGEWFRSHSDISSFLDELAIRHLAEMIAQRKEARRTISRLESLRMRFSVNLLLDNLGREDASLPVGICRSYGAKEDELHAKAVIDASREASFLMDDRRQSEGEEYLSGPAP